MGYTELAMVGILRGMVVMTVLAVLTIDVSAFPSEFEQDSTSTLVLLDDHHADPAAQAQGEAANMVAAAAKETDEADTQATAAADLSANAGAEVATTQAAQADAATTEAAAKSQATAATAAAATVATAATAASADAATAATAATAAS